MRSERLKCSKEEKSKGKKDQNKQKSQVSTPQNQECPNPKSEMTSREAFSFLAQPRGLTHLEEIPQP
jgi:hypothetical protein